MDNKNSSETSSLMILSISLFILLVTFKYLKSSSQRAPLPPGPTPMPIFGCLFQMFIMNKHMPRFRYVHQVMDKMNTDIACIRVGKVHLIPVKSPEIAKEFLKKQDETFSSRPNCMSGRISSDGYLTTIISSFGDQWKKMRRVIVTQLLSPAKHNFFHQKRSQEADHLVRYVLNQCSVMNGSGIVNVRTAAQQYCGNLIRRLVFGKRFFGKGMEDGGPGVEEEEHVHGIIIILLHLYGMGVADYIPWLEVFDVNGHKRTLEHALRDVRKYQDPEIDERVCMWENGMKDKEDDILDVLINLKDSNNFPLLTVAEIKAQTVVSLIYSFPAEIKAQTVEIMLAAIDNPSNALEWALGEMINYPEIFERAQKELDEVVGRDRLVQESDMSKLNFIKACAKEAFRLHPILPFNVPHVPTEDTVVSGYFIPKGSHVLLSRMDLGRNPMTWNEPHKYKPERHINNDGLEVTLAEHELRLISFSTGRRGCPATLLGSTMTIMLFARLIQGFTWSAPTDEKASVELIQAENYMLLATPLMARAKPRLNLDVYKQLQK